MSPEPCGVCRFWDQRAGGKDMPEVFQFLTVQWDIDKARKLVALGVVEDVLIDVADLVGAMGFINVSERHARHLTPEQAAIPIIAGWIDLGGWLPIPIDGWHRVARAGLDGKATIRGHQLTKAQSESVRTSTPLRMRSLPGR